MIGTSLYLCIDDKNKLNCEVLLKEPWHKLREINNDSCCELYYSFYDSYPIKSWEFKDSIIVFEGCIFNMSDIFIEDAINKLSEIEGKRVLTEISSFVESAEGDFIITIYNRITSRIVIFNDILGGMSAHYYQSNTCFIFSRSLSFVAVNSSSEISRENLAEYLTFGYNLGDHTQFEYVKKLEPASCLICDRSLNISISLFKTVEPNFHSEDKFRTKNEAIRALCDLFIASCKRRIEYAQSHGYEIINTISGGFDSRAIVGGLEKFTQSYTNVTYEYKQDESKIAKELLSFIDSKSKYIKFSFDNIPQLDNSQLTYETDGKIECFTNSICYNDLKFAKETELKDKKILFFGGFGGEYLRHPFFPFFLSPQNWPFFNSPSVKISSKIFLTSKETVLDSIYQVIKPFSKEKTILAKYLYNEYYQNLVRCSGEDRTRLFFFTIQPMMSSDFILTLRNRVPLKWIGFRFFKSFLEEIDKRLVKVNFMNNSGQLFSINSNYNLFKKDLKQKYNIRSYIRLVKRRYTHIEFTQDWWSNVDFELISGFYEKLHDKSVLDIDFVRKYYKAFGLTTHLRLLTILEYLYEIDKVKHSI